MAEITYRDAIRDALREEMQRDERVFIMGEEVGVWGGSYAVTQGMLKEFGDRRIKDTPISEGVIVGAGIGAAMAGLRPICELMTINFGLLASDMLINHAAKLHYMFAGQIKVPLVVRAVGGGGRQLAATHSQSLESVFAYIPGLKVVMPATPYDAKGLLKAAIRDDDPVLYIEHSLLYPIKGEVPDGDYTVPIGVTDVKREGRDVTIIGYSRMVHVALEAAQKLEDEGISAEVLDLRTLRPLDTEPLIRSFMKTNHAMIVEEDWRSYGIGAEVACQIYEQAFGYLDAPIVRCAGVEVPMPYAKNLEAMAIPTVGDVVRAAKELVQ
ncbi:MAG: alpha-ketoacid dehydrogenase subunit beta [Chloroflexi bacterium]|nr:MAG: alpha-ketoacid dehydrogenase subunit beta [Chloroflexota bacterium]